MAKKRAKSIEEQIESAAKNELTALGIHPYTKTEDINNEIATALSTAQSKSGGKGNNYPDIKVFLETSAGRRLPIMIEVKGTEGDFIKVDEHGSIAMSDASGKPIFANRKKYAVNGAVHYAEAVIKYSRSYEEVIAIGINGFDDEGGNRVVEYGVYYVSKDNLLVPKKIGDYTSLSFLSDSNLDELVERINNLELSDAEQEQKTRMWEFQIEDNLKELNQEMHDVHQISEDYRVKLIAGLIMAGVGIKNEVMPLAVTELRSVTDQYSHDGHVILNKIKSYLDKKNLPDEKKAMIVAELAKVFIHTKLYEPVNGESPLKSIYSFLDKNILPLFNEKIHVDFTGKLFNTLNAWVKVPDGNQNDVVLTPRYVCEMMASMCKVNKDSYVWDYALGSAGFLIAAMKQMIAAAITVFVPDGFFTAFAGYPLLSMITVVVVAIPMYVCSTGSIPIALSLMLKGLSPGAAFVLLMAGPAANFASILIVSKTLGKKTAAIYLGTIVLGAISIGMCIDTFMPRDWFPVGMTSAMATCHVNIDIFSGISSAILILLLINALILRYTHYKSKNMGKGQLSITVKGMSCGHCKAMVEKNLAKLPGVESVDVDLVTGNTVIHGDADTAAVRDVIEELGFEVV